MVIISSFLALPLAAALLQPSLADVTPNNPSNIIPRMIVGLKPNTVPPNEDGRREFLQDVLGIDFNPVLNRSLILFWGETTLNGFAGNFSDSALEKLRRQPQYDFDQPDLEITPAAVIATSTSIATAATTTQTNAFWNVARLTSGTNSFSGQNVFANSSYVFNPGNFATAAYVVDTGCDEKDPEMEGRAAFIGSFGGVDPFVAKDPHGNQVATVIGGRRLGVAKQALVNCIKISKSPRQAADTSAFISGMNLALFKAQTTPRLPSVIVAAWQSPNNTALDRVVSNVIEQGFPVIVGAGNNKEDVTNVSPARVDGVITVAATSIDDVLADFSNFGPRVTILAPGQAIVVQNDINASTGPDKLVTVDGTSFAAAHVAGLSLLLMSQDGKQLNSAALTERLTSLALKDVIKNVPSGTPNLLLSSDLCAPPSA